MAVRLSRLWGLCFILFWVFLFFVLCWNWELQHGRWWERCYVHGPHNERCEHYFLIRLQHYTAHMNTNQKTKVCLWILHLHQHTVDLLYVRVWMLHMWKKVILPTLTLPHITLWHKVHNLVHDIKEILYGLNANVTYVQVICHDC